MAHLHGSGGATYTKNLIGDIDIRDYCNGSLTNAINGITTVNVFRCPKTNNGTEGRLDMQHIVLPDEFADQTLKTIKLVDNGRWGLQRVVLDGVTVAVVPTPQSSAASASRQKINGNHSDHRRLTTLLKKKLHGRVAYNPKTGELVLTYDWAVKDNLTISIWRRQSRCSCGAYWLCGLETQFAMWPIFRGQDCSSGSGAKYGGDNNKKLWWCQCKSGRS